MSTALIEKCTTSIADDSTNREVTTHSVDGHLVAQVHLQRGHRKKVHRVRLELRAATLVAELRGSEVLEDYLESRRSFYFG